MKKLYRSVLLKAVFLFSALFFCGCAREVSAEDNSSPYSQPELQVNDLTEDFHNDYTEVGGQVAMITNTAPVDDQGFIQAVYEGVQIYAHAAGVSYSHYSAAKETSEEYLLAVTAAIENDAGLIVCAGSEFAPVVGSLQNLYPGVHFLLIDSVPADSLGKEVSISPNVHCITYREEEAGYLAGYMTVLEGCTRFGFIGGEEIPPVQQFGYGYLQGIDAAAASLGITEQIRVNYWYADSFHPSEKIENTANKWYQAGTQVIFSCGGSIYESVLSAADSCGGLVIGVDSDQSGLSQRVLTSAAKGVEHSVVIALDEYFASGDRWPEDLAGQSVSYGAAEKCVELPTGKEAWRFKQATQEDYWELFTRLKKGEISISDHVTFSPVLAIRVTYFYQ